MAGPAKSTIVRSLQEGRYGTFPRTGENEKESFISREIGREGRGPVGDKVPGCQWVSVISLVEKPTRNMEDVDPGELPQLTAASFHRHSIPSQGGLSPGLQLGDRFLGDLERRPVLLWTAHSAAAAAVPGACLAPPGGEWGAHGLWEQPARSGEAQPRKAPHSRRNLTPAPSSGPSEDGAGGSGCPRLGRETASGPTRPGGLGHRRPAQRVQGTARGFATLRSLLAAPALLSRPPRF